MNQITTMHLADYENGNPHQPQTVTCNKLQSHKSSYQAWKCVSFGCSLLAIVLLLSKWYEVTTDLHLLLGINKLLSIDEQQHQLHQLHHQSTDNNSSSTTTTSSDEETGSSNSSVGGLTWPPMPLEELLPALNESAKSFGLYSLENNSSMLMSHMHTSLNRELNGNQLLKEEVEMFIGFSEKTNNKVNLLLSNIISGNNSAEFRNSKLTLSLSSLLLIIYLISWILMTLAINDTRISNDISLRNILILCIFGGIDIAASFGFVMLRIIMYSNINSLFARDIIGSAGLKDSPVRLSSDQLTAFTALRLISMRSCSAYVDIYVSVVIVLLTILRLYAILRAITYYRRLRRLNDVRRLHHGNSSNDSYEESFDFQHTRNRLDRSILPFPFLNYPPPPPHHQRHHPTSYKSPSRRRGEGPSMLQHHFINNGGDPMRGSLPTKPQHIFSHRPGETNDFLQPQTFDNNPLKYQTNDTAATIYSIEHKPLSSYDNSSNNNNDNNTTLFKTKHLSSSAQSALHIPRTILRAAAATASTISRPNGATLKQIAPSVYILPANNLHESKNATTSRIHKSRNNNSIQQDLMATKAKKIAHKQKQQLKSTGTYKSYNLASSSNNININSNSNGNINEAFQLIEARANQQQQQQQHHQGGEMLLAINTKRLVSHRTTTDDPNVSAASSSGPISATSSSTSVACSTFQENNADRHEQQHNFTCSNESLETSDSQQQADNLQNLFTFANQQQSSEQSLLRLATEGGASCSSSSTDSIQHQKAKQQQTVNQTKQPPFSYNTIKSNGNTYALLTPDQLEKMGGKLFLLGAKGQENKNQQKQQSATISGLSRSLAKYKLLSHYRKASENMYKKSGSFTSSSQRIDSGLAGTVDEQDQEEDIIFDNYSSSESSFVDYDAGANNNVNDDEFEGGVEKQQFTVAKSDPFGANSRPDLRIIRTIDKKDRNETKRAKKQNQNKSVEQVYNSNNNNQNQNLLLGQYYYA